MPSGGPEFPVSVEKGVGETRMTSMHSQSKPDSHRAPMSELRLQTKKFYLEVMGRCIFKSEDVCQSICLSRAAFRRIPAERSGAGTVVRYPWAGPVGSPFVGIVPGLSIDLRPQSRDCSASKAPTGTHPTLSLPVPQFCQAH